MTDNDDLYLSDIHIENENSLNDKDNKLYKTRIEFCLSNVNEPVNDNKILIDDDGDLIVDRNTETSATKHILYIYHHRETKLDDVGLQLWRATFYLTDYLIYLNSLNEHLYSFNDKVVVDLGTGLGFTSFISTLFNPKRIYSTDLQKCLSLAEKNWLSNKLVFENITNQNIDNIYFKEIDWFDHENLFKSKNSTKFSLNEDDIEYVKEASIFIAADVIYDDAITSAFMNTVYKLMTNGSHCYKICIISNEQRINFNIDYLTITDTAYDYFKECLNDLNGYIDEEKKYRFEVENINFDFQLPKYVKNYNRNDHMYIWIIKCYPI